MILALFSGTLSDPVCPMTKIQTWRAVAGYEGIYEVGDAGMVRSLDRLESTGRKLYGVVLKHLYRRGYSCVHLSARPIIADRMCMVHRLVAVAFLENPDNKPEVNHINGVKGDNAATNLEWCTSLENTRHAFRTGLRTPWQKGAHVTSKLGSENIASICEMRLSGMSLSAIASHFSLDTRTVSKALKINLLK